MGHVWLNLKMKVLKSIKLRIHIDNFGRYKRLQRHRICIYPFAPHLWNIKTSIPQLQLGTTTQGRGTYQLHKYTQWPYWSTLNTGEGKGVQNLTSFAKDTQMHSLSINR